MTHVPSRVRVGLRVRALLFISAFLALAIGITVVAMSWDARAIVIEQVARDVEVLSQSIAVSQQLPDQVEDVLGQGMQATATAQLRAGALLLTYTDGVTEAFDGQLGAYGEQRLLDLVRLSNDARAHPLMEQIFSDVASFADGAPQSDDITAAALTWEGKTS